MIEIYVQKPFRNWHAVQTPLVRTMEENNQLVDFR